MGWRDRKDARWMTAAYGSFAVGAALVIPSLGIDACQQAPVLETRTFELQYMRPDEALVMIQPYVYGDRPGASGLATHFSGGITVRETPESLARIEAVLEEYDRPQPGVRLHFQVIEADGFVGRDARIADVQEALEELFRFDGYQLVTEAQLAMIEGTNTNQTISEDGRDFRFMGQVLDVRGSGSTASVTLEILLQAEEAATGQLVGVIQSSMVVPVGQTVVIGSTKPRDQPTMILTVRPELVELP